MTNIEQNIETPIQPEKFEVDIKDSNYMQRDLIIRAKERSGVEALGWIKEVSDRFRRLITEKPELCSGYLGASEEEKLKMLRAMERELYLEDEKRVT